MSAAARFERDVIFRDLKPANVIARSAEQLRGPPADPQHRHKARPPFRALKRLLDSDNVCVRRRRAKLVVDLHELMQETGTGLVRYGAWATVRGLEQLDAIRQDLHRMRKLLATYGAKLSFASPTIDLRDEGLRALVRRELAAASRELEIRESDGEVSQPVDETNRSGICLECGQSARVPVEELVSQRSRGIFAPMRELRKRYHLGHGRLKRILEAKGLTRARGRQPIETLRSPGEVEAATLIALSNRRFKVRMIEVAQVLHVAHRTAARFIERARARHRVKVLDGPTFASGGRPTR